MSDIQDIFNQYLDRAELLFNEGKIKEAYTLCMKVLENDPENSRAINIKKEIEYRVENHNTRSVDERLEVLKPLWEKGEYAKLVKELTDLCQYAPHYEKLEKALAQAQDMYRQMYMHQESEKRKEYETKLAELFKTKKYTELLELMQKNAAAVTQDAQLRTLHATYKENIIQEKIKEKKSLFESEKYEDIVNFLLQLQEIDRNSPTLISYLRTYREKLLASQIDDKQEFVLKSSENAKMLYQLGKYEKAMEVAEEILHLDPKNSTAKGIYQKSKKTYEKELEESTENQIKANFQAFSEEQKVKPEGFKRL